jgi:PhnB protein
MSQLSASTVTVSLTCKRASEALAFYSKAFGAKEIFRLGGPDGSVGHAAFMVGSTLMNISDENSEWHAQAMPEGTKASCLFSIATEDCDQAFATAVAAGATPLNSPQNYFWGKRTGMICDPFGYRWTFSQHIEDVSPEEMMQRARAHMAGTK